MKIRKGDTVKVIAGKHKGTVAEVLSVSRKNERAVVEAVNVKKKSVKKADTSSSESFVFIQHPIHISNLVKVDSGESKASKKEKNGEEKTTKKTTKTRKARSSK